MPYINSDHQTRNTFRIIRAGISSLKTGIGENSMIGGNEEVETDWEKALDLTETRLGTIKPTSGVEPVLLPSDWFIWHRISAMDAIKWVSTGFLCAWHVREANTQAAAPCCKCWDGGCTVWVWFASGIRDSVSLSLSSTTWQVEELEGKTPGWLLWDSCGPIRVPVLIVDEAKRDETMGGKIDLLCKMEPDRTTGEGDSL